MAALVALGLPASARAQADARSIDPSRTQSPSIPRPPQDIDFTMQSSASLPPAMNANGPEVFVGSISLSGLGTLAVADFADIVGAHLGRTLDMTELASLANRIAERAREKGLMLATAEIPPQNAAVGMITVAVDEGHIDRIEFVGGDHDGLRQVLQPLTEINGIRQSDLERRILAAADIPGIVISGLRIRTVGGVRILVVTFDHDPAALRMRLTNEASKPLGPVHAKLDLDLNGVLFARDAVSVSYAGAIIDPDELSGGRVRYALPLGRLGTQFSIEAALSRSNPGAYLEPFDLQSRSWSIGASVIHPLLRTRSASIWLQGQVELRSLSQDLGAVAVRRDRLSAARLALFGITGSRTNQLSAGLTVTKGLGQFDHPGGAPLALPRADFLSALAWMDWVVTLPEDLSLRVAARSFWADGDVPLSEQFTLGGADFMRGYDWAERAGARGTSWVSELRYDLEPRSSDRSSQLYTFLDAGTVPEPGPQPVDRWLVSAGGGLRLGLVGPLDLGVEIAVPMTSTRYDTGDRSPRLNLAIGLGF